MDSILEYLGQLDPLQLDLLHRYKNAHSLQELAHNIYARFNMPTDTLNGMINLYTSGDASPEELVQWLIDNNALNNTLNNEDTPLIFAIQQKDEALVKLLLDAGADPNFSTDHMPLTAAIINDTYNIVKLLLDAGAKKDDAYIPNAIKFGDKSLLSLLLAKFASTGEDYLPDAIESADPDMVEYILDNNYAQRANLNNALELAVNNMAPSIAKLLLSRGADPNMIDTNSGKHILKYVIETIGNTALVSVLLDAGADPNLIGDDALISAVAQYNPYLADLLLTHGYTKNLHYAMVLAVEKYNDPKIPERYKNTLAMIIQLFVEAGEPMPEGVFFNDSCSEYTLAKLREIAKNAGVETNFMKDGSDIPKLKSELCFDMKVLPKARKFLEEYSFDTNLSDILVRSTRMDMRMDKLLKGKAAFLKRINDESLHVYVTDNSWLNAQKDFLKSNHCFGISYCDFVRGYSHHGDGWISNIIEGDVDNIRTYIDNYNSMHSNEHPFYTVIQNLTEKYGINCPENTTDACDVYAMIIQEIAKNLVHIILTSPVTQNYITVYRGESSNYPGNAREGDIYTNTRFMSTSVDSNIARKFADKQRTMRILIPPGSHALATTDCTKFAYEFEIILPPKCSFVVLQSTFQTDSSQILDLLLIKQPEIIHPPLCANKVFKKEPVIIF